jgi:hypothetical protein
LKTLLNVPRKKKLLIKDFRCPSGHVTERFVENHVVTTPCQECNQLAATIISGTSFQLPGNDPHGFPTAHAKWTKKREQKMKQEASQGITPFGEADH